MKSTLNNMFRANIYLFEKRFPALYAVLGEMEPLFRAEGAENAVAVDSLIADGTARAADTGQAPAAYGTAAISAISREGSGGSIPDAVLSAEQLNTMPNLNGLRFFTAKSGAVSAEENGVMMHSRYDPLRDAERSAAGLDVSDKEAVVFCGFGLGYEVIKTAQLHPKKTLILIEPEPFRLALSFFCTDWAPVFACADIVFLIGASYPSVISILEKTGIDSCFFFNAPQWKLHAPQYFDGLSELIQRNRLKKHINDKTLESFSSLWLRNTCMNIKQLAVCETIQQFYNSAAGLRACVIAAGPSLDSAAPYLRLIRQKMIVICVDTALRACLLHNIEPDFIVLADPQYWNARHLDRVSAPNSILLTETAAYPSVFSFSCKKICLFSSMYPVGEYFETFTGTAGKLGAGGSVASTAWDFARFIGSSEIFTVGLDLGFPAKRTHAHGSTFEEKVHTQSNRTIPASTAAVNALYGAGPFYTEDYTGGKILTDKRMSLYAWWFESKCAEFPQVRTYTLSHKSLRIKGVMTYEISDVGSLTDDGEQFRTAVLPSVRSGNSAAERRETAERAVTSLEKELALLVKFADTGVAVCSKADKYGALKPGDMQILSKLDTDILSSSCAGAAALVFPTENQLKKKYPNLWLSTDNALHIRRSLIVYQELRLSACRVAQNLECGKRSFFS